MKFSEYNAYHLELEITSADITNVINHFNDAGIKLYNLIYIDALSIRFKISPKDYDYIIKISKKLGFSVKYIQLVGIQQWIKRLIKRPIMCASILILLIFSIIVPSKVFFVSVEGNVTIPTNEILEIAEKNGIGFGTSRRAVRSEKIKNLLLENIPGLQWVGINTSGCTAVISVKEKTPQQESENNDNAVCSIVASRDGIIQSFTVLKGTPLLNVGQAVTKGQILVSGYMDCGIVTKTTQADAEIIAMTFRELNVVTPAPLYEREKIIDQKVRYSIRLGKNIINLYKDSGILDMTCGKIYVEDCLKLPGGFQLPLSIIKETTFFYSDAQNMSVISDEEAWLKESANVYIENQMISGEVISSQISVEQNADAAHLYGRYACSEMIGQVKYEDSILKDDENDGEDNKIRSN